jgi:hypothetical protein
MNNPTMTNEQIIDYLMKDIPALLEEKEPLDINDGFGDYLEGIISRSQTILRMMGVPEDQIPSDGSC